MANESRVLLRLGGANVEDVVEKLGEKIRFDNILEVPDSLGEDELRDWIMQEWNSTLPEWSDYGIDEWGKVSKEKQQSFWDMYDGYVEEETFEPWEGPQFNLWEITFGSRYGPPFKAIELIHDKCNLKYSYMAYEDESMGYCGSWEYWGPGTEYNEVVKYTDDRGQLLKTEALTRWQWDFAERMMTEIHGEGCYEDFIDEFDALDREWIPVAKRFK